MVDGTPVRTVNVSVSIARLIAIYMKGRKPKPFWKGAAPALRAAPVARKRLAAPVNRLVVSAVFRGVVSAFTPN